MLNDFLDRMRQLHTACLSSTPGVYLGFDHPQLATEFSCRRRSVLRGRRDLALGHRNSELGEECLGLVLVKIQRESRLAGAVLSTKGKHRERDGTGGEAAQCDARPENGRSIG